MQSENPILSDGQPGYAYDSTGGILKVGDGTTAWNDLMTVANSEWDGTTRTPITSNVDLNSFFTNGFYQCATSTYTATNAPISESYWTLDVLDFQNYTQQIYTSVTTGRKFYRYYNGTSSTWSAWSEYLTVYTQNDSGDTTYRFPCRLELSSKYASTTLENTSGSLAILADDEIIIGNSGNTIQLGGALRGTALTSTRDFPDPVSSSSVATKNYVDTSINIYSDTFTNVTDTYDSNNLLFYKGTWMTPSRFPNSNFLIILSSNNELHTGSIWILTFGTTDTNDQAYALNMTNTADAPQLIKTTSGGIAVKWPNSSGIISDINACIIKIK